MLPVLICFGFLFFILHDTQLGLPPESHTEAQPLTNIMGECLANRTLLREAIENNGSHLMKGFTCALLKNDLVGRRFLLKTTADTYLFHLA